MHTCRCSAGSEWERPSCCCTILQNYRAELLCQLQKCLCFNPECTRAKQLQALARLHLPHWRHRRLRSSCQHGRVAVTCSQLEEPSFGWAVRTPCPRRLLPTRALCPLLPILISSTMQLIPLHLPLLCLCQTALRSPQGLDWGRGRAEHFVFQGKEETVAQMKTEQKSTYCCFQQHKIKTHYFGTANFCSKAGRNAV